LINLERRNGFRELTVMRDIAKSEAEIFTRVWIELREISLRFRAKARDPYIL
jgi:hypothetical protein